jgi:hypothetical protein
MGVHANIWGIFGIYCWKETENCATILRFIGFALPDTWVFFESLLGVQGCNILGDLFKIVA